MTFPLVDYELTSYATVMLRGMLMGLSLIYAGPVGLKFEMTWYYFRICA